MRPATNLDSSSKQFPRPLFRGALAVGMLLSAAACNDDPAVPPDHAEEVAEVRLTVGLQIVSISDNGTVTGGPIAIFPGAFTVTATFHAADGDEVEVHDDEFRLDVGIASAGTATFTRTAAFSGTLTGIAAGSATAEVCLYHLEEDHCDFGPFAVEIVVQ